MRRLIAVMLVCAALPVAAQNTPPKDLQPLPEPPPPPPGLELEPSLEPQVTIIKRAEQTVEEFRINGRLYMMKITPSSGAPYYLVDQTGNGQFTRLNNIDTGIHPPMWVIHQF